jgi:Tfp pilus assembly protein PilW
MLTLAVVAGILAGGLASGAIAVATADDDDAPVTRAELQPASNTALIETDAEGVGDTQDADVSGQAVTPDAGGVSVNTGGKSVVGTPKRAEPAVSAASDEADEVDQPEPDERVEHNVEPRHDDAADHTDDAGTDD